MSQSEMRSTSVSLHDRKKEFQDAIDEYQSVLAEFDLDMLRKYPVAYVGEMTKSEYTKFKKAVDKLPEVVDKLREADVAHEEALKDAQDAYNRHNDLSH